MSKKPLSFHMSKQAFPFNQITDHPNCYHKNYWWKQMQRPTAKYCAELLEFRWREGGGIIWTRGVKNMMGITAEREFTWASRISRTMDWQLQTELGPLNVGDSYVAWSVCGEGLKVRPRPNLGAWTGFLERIPCGVIPCSTLMQREGIWSCLNLVCHTLLTPQGRTYSLWGGDGKWEAEEVGGQEKGMEGELGLLCKLKKQFK